MDKNLLEMEVTVQFFIKNKIEFIIPSYQRGYRWGNQQVIDLLKDLEKFIKDNENSIAKYSLQPLVVKKEHNLKKYTVIDGQQRLTTIFILLMFIKEYKPKIDIGFEISYETRENSSQYLKNISLEKECDKNIDYFFMKQAYEAIKSYIENCENPDSFVDDLYKKLSSNIIFLWYDIADENPIELFKRRSEEHTSELHSH